MKKIFSTIIFIIICVFTINAQTITVRFNNLFNGTPLEFGKHYKTPLGDSVKFSTLNYFISNLKLVKQNGALYTLPQDSNYFLLKQTTNASASIQLNNVPTGNYTGIQFTIGVDSIRNTMDVAYRTGSLDVGGEARGMYWVWNSGYIFFKLEGTTINDVSALKKGFRYHIGGYGGYETKSINNIKSKEFSFANMEVTLANKLKIDISVSIDQFFNAITPIHILEHPSVMSGDFSGKIAENYATIFTLEKISYE